MAAIPQGPPLPNTVLGAMIACGLDNVTVNNGMTNAARIATDCFDNSFDTCLDKSFDDIEADFKTFSVLDPDQGQIRLMPGQKNRIKAFIQWVRNMIRTGLDPSLLPFPIANTPLLLRHYHTHLKFVKDSKTLSEASKPKEFTAETKWSEWIITFRSYLRTIPGRDGVSLSYVIRNNAAPTVANTTDILRQYESMAPLTGNTFISDASTVHTLLVNLITGNETAEAKIASLATISDGRSDYLALRNHYEGVGVHALDITKAEDILDNLYYSGEKPPHMWWDEFEKELDWAYNTYDTKEQRQVHSNEMKLRTLMSKIKCDKLAAVKASMTIELSKIPLTMTYDVAKATFRNAVNQMNPPQLKNNKTTTRRYVRETNQGRSTGGRGTGRGYGNQSGRGGGRNGYGRGGYGRGGYGRGGRGRGNYVQKTRNDSCIITLTDGQKIEYHPSFRFPYHILQKFKDQDRDRLNRERDAYRERQNMQRRIEELESFHQSGPPTENTSTNGTEPPRVIQATATTTQTNLERNSNASVSEVSQSTRSTMFGGRNERQLQRTRRGYGRW